MGKKKARGPRGGIKHQPGRGHDRKSAKDRKKRFAKEAAQRRRDAEGELKAQWDLWDQLTDEQKALRPDLKPGQPRPTDGSS